MRIEGLSFSYKGGLKVFSDLSISSDSHIIALKGPPGCGKTTLLKLISGMLEADSVRCLEVQQGIVLVVQEDSLLPWLSGLDNLAYILRVAPSKIAEHRLYSMVAPFSKQKAFTMSYGQRRILELFRAILYKPGTLCLDEPFNFMDTPSRRRILSYLSSPEMADTTIILSTHHADDLDGLEADHFLFDGVLPVQRLLRG